MKLKVDTGADICAVNTDDLQDFLFPVDIKENNSLLEEYGPGTIKNIGATSLKLHSETDQSIQNLILYAPRKLSVIGCAQAQQLGIITVNIDDIESKVFWPGITNDIKQLVKDCDICNRYQAEQPKLPVMQPDLTTRPWEKLETDIFVFKENQYLMIVDYYSKFPVIRLLGDITADTICNHFTSVLAEYGLPSVIIADFGISTSAQNLRIVAQRVE